MDKLLPTVSYSFTLHYEKDQLICKYVNHLEHNAFFS